VWLGYNFPLFTITSLKASTKLFLEEERQSSGEGAEEEEGGGYINGGVVARSDSYQ